MIRWGTLSDFAQIYEIMSVSFPETEYRTRAEQEALFEDERYKVLVFAEGHNGRVVAFLAIWKMKSFVFIEHLAVLPEFRNSGIGKSLLEALVSSIGSEICLEVEPPDEEIKRRRIAFYGRLGFVLNNYPYIQPSITKGQPPIPLMVMTYPCGVCKTRFEEIRAELYREVYKTE